MPDKKLTVDEFALKIKAKYPEYKDMDNYELSNKIIQKYPDYSNTVDLKKKAVSQIGGFGSQLGSQTFQPIETYISTPVTGGGKTQYSEKQQKISDNLNKNLEIFAKVQGTPLANVVANIPAQESVLGQGEKDKSFISKAVDAAGYIASGFNKGIKNVVSGAIQPLANAGLIPGTTGATAEACIEQASQPFMESKQQAAKYGEKALLSQLHGLAEFIPASIGAESTAGATFFLNGYGSGLDEVKKLKQEGQKFENGSDDIYALGRGLVDWLLMSRLNSHTIFSKLPSSLRDDVAGKLSMEALGDVAKLGENATTDDVINLFKDKALGFNDKLKQLGTDYLKSYTNTAVDLTALNTANFGLGKLTNKLAGEDIFKQTPEDLLKSVGKIVTLEAPIFAAFGAVKDAGQLFRKSPYTNVIVDNLYKDSSPENVDAIKRDLSAHLEEKGLAPQEIQKSVESVDKIASISKTLPTTLSVGDFKNGVELIDGREELKQQLQDLQKSRESLDESVRGLPAPEEELVKAKLEQSNDKLKELATRQLYKYDYDKANDIYTKQLGNNEPEQISKDRYDLENLEKQFKTKQNAVQEQSTTGQVPPIIEGGQVVPEGGERMGQGIKGAEAPQEIVPEEVVTLRAQEQQELKDKIPNIEQYKVDGKVDKSLITDSKDLKKYNKIYDKYDKLITPAIREAKQQGVRTVKLEVNEDLTNNGIGLRAVEMPDGKFGIFKEIDGKVTGKSLGRSFDTIEELQSAYKGGIKDALTADAIKQAEIKAQETVVETPELTDTKVKLLNTKSETSRKRLFEQVKSLSTEEQLNKFVEENPQLSKYVEKPVTEVKAEEPKTTSLENAEVAKKRADYGFDQPVEFKTKPNEETLSDAKKQIEKGKSVYNIIEKANNREPLTATETAMLAVFQGTKEAELIDANKKIEGLKDSGVLDFDKQVEARNKIIDDLIAAYNASETSGNVAGLALQARKIKVLQDYSLANMLIKARKANDNAKLPDAKIEQVTKAYNDLVEVKNKLNAKLDKLREENQKLRLNEAIPALLKQAALEARDKARAETKETLKAEREAIFKELSDIAKKSRGELSANPIKPEMLPVLAKLAKNYFKEGVVSVEEVVDRLYTDLQNVVEGVTKADIREGLIDSQKDNRPSKDELISEVENAKNDLKNAEQEVGKDKAKLNAYKNNIKKRIDELSGKIKNKDYSKKEVKKLELDDEAKALQKQYADIKFKFDVDLAKDRLQNRTKFQKYVDLGLELANVPRAIMASADLSAPLRQGLIPTISNPVMAAKAFKESLKQFGDAERSEKWLSELKHSDGYQLMKDSGLYIADPKSVEMTAKEEDFQTNLAEKIPGAGELVKASERSYVGYLNKMRVDLFTRGVDALEADGKTFASDPEAYKALAKYVNASTGRGSMGPLEGAAPYLNTVFFSPRLIASRLQLLTQWANPLYYKNTPVAVRKMYFKDMGKIITWGLTVLALAKLNGADVEDDPRSSDFGKIRIRDTRWDIWGGFQQPIRYIVQIVSGQKKSSATGKISELNGKNYSKETRLSTLASFVRSKLSPIPGLAVDALAGENMVGEKFDIVKNLPKLITPLVWQGVYESAKNDGWGYGLGAVGVPSIFGVGVQTYGTNNFLQSGVDDKSIKLLQSKKATAIEPKEHDKLIYDVEKGTERDMTSDEFQKYYATWSNYIKDDLAANHDKYAKMSNDQFDKEFRSMKSQASKVAKEAVSGLSDDTRTIRVTMNGEPVTYELTPKEVKIRQQLNKKFIAENQYLLNKYINDAIIEKKSPFEAQVQAKKKLNSEANSFSKKIILERYKIADGIYDFGAKSTEK